ncbi:hypothetical protein ES705_09009 [subsurface metagenome]
MPITEKNSETSQVKIDNKSNEIPDFKFLKPPPNTNLRGSLDSMINYANDRVNEYVQLRKMYLEVNLTLMIVIFAFISIVFEYFSDLAKLFTIFLLTLYLAIAGYNILYNLRAHKIYFEKEQSKHNWKFRNKISSYIEKLNKKRSEKNPTKNSEINIWTANRFFRGNVPEKVQDLKSYLSKFALNKFDFTKVAPESIKLSLEEKLLKDDVKNLFILFWYQKSYYKHAMMTRTLTLASMIYIFFSSIIILLVNLLC